MMRRLMAAAALGVGALGVGAGTPASAHPESGLAMMTCGATRSWPMNTNVQVYHAHVDSMGSGWVLIECEGTDLINNFRWKAYALASGPFGPFDVISNPL